MKPGDLIQYKDFWRDHQEYAMGTGLIVSDRSESSYAEDDGTRLFEIMIDGRLVRAFEYEIEVVSENG
jgi:hypothetical protein